MQKMKIYDMSHADSVIRESDLAPTLVARMGTGGGGKYQSFFLSKEQTR